ncbi:MAG: PAS domain-containing protein, partial [Anaerolineae bacterium]|nr:PAS domain-containing protein [Anaerolineae bacterium]
PVNGMLAIQILRYGAWFWVNVFQDYLLVFLGAGLIIRHALRSYNLYRQQSIWLVMGGLIPLFGNVIYIFRLIPGLVQDYTSVTFALAGVVFSIGMTRHHLFDLQPVARDAVVDSMSDVMFALDNQGRVVDMNPAALALMGTEADVILGQSATQAFSPWRDMMERFKDTLEIQTDIAVEYKNQERHYDFRILPLRDRREDVIGRLIVVRDITDRKVNEVALRERTAELEVLNEQLDAFAHTVAHDIKDPLTGVVALTSLLSEYFEELTPDAIAEYLDAITQNTMRLANIVDALLLLASVRQLEAINTEPLNMPGIVANVEKRLSVLIAERQAVLVAPKTWPEIRSYGPWVEEVWANYISNAIKYGGRSAEGILPRVEIGYSRLDTESSFEHPASSLKFWVRDNGPGLAIEQQRQLFTRFIRLRDAEPGHGLGLSIARNVVEKLGGKVGVESEVGQGSTFWFTLPVS